MKQEFALLKKILNKKIVCFGTGIASEKFTDNFPLEISYYVDNNPNRWNLEFMNKTVYEPGLLLKENKANLGIIIMSMYHSEIAGQLKGMGFSENVHFWNGFEIYYNIIFSAGQEIILDYPVNSNPRYGYGRPPHQKLLEIIENEKETYLDNLSKFMMFKDNLLNIKNERGLDDYEPHWVNGSMPILDATSIYCFIALSNCRNFFEIGSGNSTKFARRSINDHRLKTKITSFDPQPRAEIDAICDNAIRKPIEEVDLSIFNQLEEGDILFVDNSHRSFMNSDVTIVFLDILPYLKKGVLVGFHDIFIPFDYLPSWRNRYYSEQYLLASYLLAEGNKFQIELPCTYASYDQLLNSKLILLFKDFSLDKLIKGGASFWIRMK